jgi:hypothetical protein
MMLKTHSPARRRGTTVVETAVVALICLTFMFAIFEYGRYVMVRQVMENAARVGGRVAVVTPTSYVAPATATAQVNAAITQALASIPPEGDADRHPLPGRQQRQQHRRLDQHAVRPQHRRPDRRRSAGDVPDLRVHPQQQPDRPQRDPHHRQVHDARRGQLTPAARTGPKTAPRRRRA